ncbi:MAG: hypothetical protein J6K45_06505 [Clostridia bacterium]|nr:hypothetical protein [Clostridia bacterium]
MVYADYEYYKKKYFGTLLLEDSFDSLVLKASREIDKNINTRLTQAKLNNLSKEAQEQLQYTACALVDLIERKKKNEDRKLSSFSIDGVSKNFNNISIEEYTQTKKDILANLPDELTAYL